MRIARSSAPIVLALATSLALSFETACATNGAPTSAPPSNPSTTAAATPVTPNAAAATPASTAAVYPSSFDPIPAATSAASITAYCDLHLGRAKSILAEVRSLKGKAPAELTWENTGLRFDDMVTEMNDAVAFPALMEVSHPDKAVREAARDCAPKADELRTSIFLDADLAAVISAYAAKKETLTAEKQRLITETLRDFHRNGIDLPAAKQAELRELNAQLTKLGQEFQQNIDASKDTLEVAEKSLEGLPKDYLAKHPLVKGKATITTDYPDYFPFITHSKDRHAALDLYVKFTNRGGEQNVKLLEKILDLRHKKANLLGYETWADYAIEPRMAKSAKTVHEFLAKVRDAVKGPAEAEYKKFVQEHVALGGKATDKLAPVERYYLEDRVKAKAFSFDSTQLAEYFPVSSVVDGLLTVTSKMYGLEFKKVTETAWHPDVVPYEVWSNGAKIGKFYLDLYPRADKFKHAAMFPIISGKRLHDGSYRMPVAALECNFPKPTGDANSPALMTHKDVTTFFHEFGHVLHHMLGTTDLASYSGTSTVQDFVEAPSQMFEEWAYSREVLDLFAHHYKTGAKIPDALFKGLQASRSFGLALETQRQLFLATLDFEYHSRAPGFDSTKALQEIQQASDSFTYVPDTHFQSSFGHLIGYDAGYYSYQWALALSRDVLTRFQKEGMLNPATAADWRKDVLSQGGGTDERENVAKFLGRQPNYDAYIAFITGR